MKKKLTTQPQKKRLIVYAFSIFIGFIVAALTMLSIVQLQATYTSHQREARILSIYADLKLDESYRSAASNIFGDKRVYEWDAGRTYASSMEFGRNANREDTFADLKNRIEAAGFKQIEGPDYGDLVRQDHYKSPTGEYIRVSIDSAEMHSAILYGTEWPYATAPGQIDEAPVYVTIKVNLDDNNE